MCSRLIKPLSLNNATVRIKWESSNCYHLLTHSTKWHLRRPEGGKDEPWGWSLRKSITSRGERQDNSRDGGESRGRHGGWHQRSTRRGCAGLGGRMEELHFLLGSHRKILSRELCLKESLWLHCWEWTMESRERVEAGRPTRMLLQWCKWDMMAAWTS